MDGLIKRASRNLTNEQKKRLEFVSTLSMAGMAPGMIWNAIRRHPDITLKEFIHHPLSTIWKDIRHGGIYPLTTMLLGGLAGLGIGNAIWDRYSAQKQKGART